MTYKLKAHWEGDVVVLDEPIPLGARHAAPCVVVETGGAPATPEEKAQSASGFATHILLDPAEDAWEND